MAKQMSIFTFTGKLGNLIGYQRNGKYFLRSVPQSVRQTAATRRASRRFGLASRKAALIRHACYPELDIRCDGAHINRLNKVLIAAGDDHTAIAGFHFNQYAGLDRFFTVIPRLFRNEVLHIPAQSIIRHKGITGLEVKVIAIRIDFMSGQVTGRRAVTLMIDPETTFEGRDIALDVPGDGTLVIILQVRALDKNGIAGNRQHMAADIITVTALQMHGCFNKRTHPERLTLQQLLIPDIRHIADKGLVQLE
ncbi:hypothetical protein [Chitinophaga pinensis]|uniref:Uncharacterized protein n=1 Tax=Chitinophaga pinensis (strain ATCC 43595 / DSM 2588 / LMG 13176 / NBRC 15968 / NCIMB 11800 / UQM 2034) TaxID=485918 RepID=A0A979GPZ7_CHIPD|nr:hypothetical protein [Chitinophaga pinensis]ACU60952.1 hypothetical protein Cpin_3485 [Chitinophaga pinensis DSM 2588]